MNPGSPPAEATFGPSSTASDIASPTVTIAAFGTYYDDSHVVSRGPIVFSVTLIFLIISFAAVALRMVTRKWIVQKISPADWIIMIAWLLSFGMCISICLGTKYGFGRHNADIPLEWLSTKQKLKYAFTLLYNPAVTATKLSILAFYLSIFTTQHLFRIFCWITLVIVVLAGLLLTLMIAFACRPLKLVLDPYSSFPSFDAGHCIGTIKIYYASAPVSVITDLCILVLPMPVLTSLRLPTIQKAILIVVFSLGGFVLVVGIIRIYYFQIASTSPGSNFDWDAAISFMWAALEVNVGILCASIPMIKPLMLRFFPKLIGVLTTNVTHSTVEEANLDYGSGTYPEGPITAEAALRPPPRSAWLSASGGQGRGVVGELEEVDAEGRISSSFRHRSYGGGGSGVPYAQKSAEDEGRSDSSTKGNGQLNEKRPENYEDEDDDEEIDKLFEGVMTKPGTAQRRSKRASMASYASATDERRQSSYRDQATPRNSVLHASGPSASFPVNPSSPTRQQFNADQDDDVPPWEKMDLNTHGK